MDEAKANKAVWTYSIWVAIFIVACGVTLLAWKTMGQLQVNVFQAGTNLEQLNAQIPEMEKHYSQLANRQKEILEIWGLAALVLGIAGGIAGILRAPQAVIVVLGGFAAIIFGATKIYDPQTSLQTLNEARSQLACIQPKIHLLTELGLKTRPVVSETLNNLTAAYRPLPEQSASYLILLNQLSDLNQSHQQKRQDAVNAIKQALLLPIPDFSSVWQKLIGQQETLEHLYYVLQGQISNNATPNQDKHIAQIEAIDQKLKEAIDRLQRPSLLHTRLDQDLASYQEVVSLAVSNIAAGKQLSSHALSLIQELPDKIAKLKQWPVHFDRAVTTAYTVVSSIQNQVISKLASGGIAQTSIEGIVQAAADMLNNPVVAADQDWSDTPEPMVLDDLLAQSEAPVSKQSLTSLILKTIKTSEQLLKTHQRDLLYADTIARELLDLTQSQQPIINGIRKMMKSVINELNAATTSLQHTVDVADEITTEADKILNQADPVQLQAGIEACI